jgi:hypothetical protein
VSTASGAVSGWHRRFFLETTAPNNPFKMSTWTDTPKCSRPMVRGAIVTRTFTYDATTTPYPTDTIGFVTLQGIDQLVIEGTIPAPNTVVYMPPHTALLELFTRPRVDDQFAIDVSNTGANSVDLTIYKANSAPTGSPRIAYTQPMRIATIPAASVVRLYFRVVDAEPVTGVADVKMLATLEGGTGSVPTPVISVDMTAWAGAAVLLTQQIIQSTQPAFQLMFVDGLAAGTVALPAVPATTAGPAQLLYPYGNTAAPALMSPLVAGDVFDVVLQSVNQSGFNLTWLTGGIAGVTLTGSTTQPSGSTYTVTFRFRIAGTAPAFLGTTLTVDLANVFSSRVGELVEGLRSPTPTSDFLKCDGSALLQSAYPSLYSKVGLLPSFTTSTIPQPTGQFGAPLLAYSPTLGLYVAASTTSFFTSTDGSNWTGGNNTWINAATHIHWSPIFLAFVVCCSSSTLNLSYDGYRFVAIETNTGVLFSHAASSATVLCAYGVQALFLGVNRIWTTVDSTLQSWSKVNLTGSTAAGAASSDLYYAPVPGVFCLGLTTPLFFSIVDGLGGLVTARGLLSGGGNANQFASDPSGTIYAATSGTAGVVYSTDTMANWLPCKATSTNLACSGVAVNPNATGTQARLVAYGSLYKGIFTSQTTIGTNTVWLTLSGFNNSNNTNVISWNGNFTGANKYVGVYNASAGSLATSADLNSWFNPSATSGLQGIAGDFTCTAADPRAGVGVALTVVAGTSTTTVRSSPDGIAWSSCTNVGAAAILYMIFSVSRGGFIGASANGFVTSLGAVGTAGSANFIVDTSTVGVPSLIKGLADNGAGTIVAITSNVTTGNNYMVWTTVPGNNWAANQLNSGDVLNGVAWNGSVFCIVTLQSSVYTSINGTAWTPRQGLDRSTLFNNVVAIGSTFMLFNVNTNDAQVFAVSIDNGVTFSTAGLPSGQSAVNYVNGLAVMCSYYGQIATSADARSWVPKSSITVYDHGGRCYYFNNLYFLWEVSGGLRVSNDGGATWTFPGSLAKVSVRSQASVAAFGKIIIAGLPFLYSTNLGVTWVNPKSFDGGSTPGTTVNDLAYSPTLGLVVGVGDLTYKVGMVLTTPDGVAWTTRFVANSLQGANGSRSMAYSSVVWAPATLGRVGMFVGCSGAYGRIITSTDGLAWSESSSGSESAMSQVCYNTALDLFCVVGELGHIATARDPLSTSWTTRVCPNRARVQGVASLETKGFVAIMAPSGLLYSPDGATWTCTLMPVSISTTNGVSVPIYYSTTLGGVLIPAATAATYMFTNDGQTVTLCQGAGSGALTYNNIRHDEVDDVLMCSTDVGFVVIPRAYNPTTQFVLPVMPNTWIRAT